MILIDKNGEIELELNKLESNTLSFLRLDADTYSISNGLEDDLILVHSSYLDEHSSIKKKLSSQVSLVVFYNENFVISDLNNIHGFYKQGEITSFIVNQVMALENLLKERVVTKSTLHSLSLEMNEIIANVDTQLARVKKSYEEKTPRRFQKIKGVKLLSKYAAGDSIGGEFLDSFIMENKIFLLMSDTSSYLASSAILEIFSETKAKKKIDGTTLVNLINQIQEQMRIIDQSKIKKQLSVGLLCAVVDLSALTIEGYCIGNFKILSNQKIDFHKTNNYNLINTDIAEGKFELEIDSFEKILILSPGLKKNWMKYCPEKMIEEIMRNTQYNIIEILDEIFFELKRNVTSGYLEHDACSIILEVDKNAIRKV